MIETGRPTNALAGDWQYGGTGRPANRGLLDMESCGQYNRL
jgi:hypothetical protein